MGFASSSPGSISSGNDRAAAIAALALAPTRGHRGGALPPHGLGAGREGGIRDLDTGGLETDGGQVAAGGVAELFFAVPVLAGRDRTDP
jgi:hypothetical protein